MGKIRTHTEALAAPVDTAPVDTAPVEEGFSLARLSDLLADIPADSVIGARVREFFEAILENYKDGPGAPARAAYNILCAAADPNDSAFRTVSVLERATICSAANALKGAFTK